MPPSAAAAPRIARLQELIRTNGVEWTLNWMAFEMLRAGADIAGTRMQRLEQTRGAPGNNSVQRNYQMWEHYDWSRDGEEWTLGAEWKQSFIEDVMRRYIEPRTSVLEIGPGAGRWSEPLQKLADRLVLVDLSPRCIELCRERLGDCANVEYYVNNGSTLAFVANETIDRIWSYDVFVHIAPPDINEYLKEMRRVLRPGGRAVIHHAANGSVSHQARTGWRSSMTAALFADLLAHHDLRLVRQFDSWGPDERFHLPPWGDIITVFER